MKTPMEIYKNYRNYLRKHVVRKIVNFNQLHLLGLITALAFLGCGKQQDGIAKVIVEGTITFDGVLVPNGEIHFYPSSGTKGPVSGGPIRDGKYVAKGRGGVPVGTHRVDIRAYRPDEKAGGDPEGSPVIQYLPLKFNSETALTATVDSSTTTMDFALTSK